MVYTHNGVKIEMSLGGWFVALVDGKRIVKPSLAAMKKALDGVSKPKREGMILVGRGLVKRTVVEYNPSEGRGIIEGNHWSNIGPKTVVSRLLELDEDLIASVDTLYKIELDAIEEIQKQKDAIMDAIRDDTKSAISALIAERGVKFKG